MRACKLILFLCFVVAFASAQSTKTQPAIIEIVAHDSSAIKFEHLNDLKGYGEELDVKQWKNRAVVFFNTSNVNGLMDRIKRYYPNQQIILFKDPFYNFNRKYCDGKGIVKEWNNIILSANLVADPKMQQEYLNYHATQFQKWPEVAKGFCNAQFQQLLVFKTGRQLMLVISLPKGKSLDELNPLTTKNNPRVDEWNNLMKKYQEGIEGTKKGETWVFFNDVNSKKAVH